jgi:uncharacterized membrane protein
MNRAEFLAALRSGLAGMEPAAIEDIANDYETHFADGAEAGRSEDEIADALGDPARLARELRTEAGLQRWEEKRTPGNAVAAVFALLGLGALDIIILLPLLVALAATLFGLFMACFGVLIGGTATLVFGPFAQMVVSPLVPALVGIALIAGAIAAGAVLIMVTIAAVNALVWYARLHYRALKLVDQA